MRENKRQANQAVSTKLARELRDHPCCFWELPYVRWIIMSQPNKNHKIHHTIISQMTTEKFESGVDHRMETDTQSLTQRQKSASSSPTMHEAGEGLLNQNHVRYGMRTKHHLLVYTWVPGWRIYVHRCLWDDSLSTTWDFLLVSGVLPPCGQECDWGRKMLTFGEMWKCIFWKCRWNQIHCLCLFLLKKMYY